MLNIQNLDYANFTRMTGFLTTFFLTFVFVLRRPSPVPFLITVTRRTSCIEKTQRYLLRTHLRSLCLHFYLTIFFVHERLQPCSFLDNQCAKLTKPFDFTVNKKVRFGGFSLERIESGKYCWINPFNFAAFQISDKLISGYLGILSIIKISLSRKSFFVPCKTPLKKSIVRSSFGGR